MDDQNDKPQQDSQAQEGGRLPVDSLREAIPFLRRPFTPEAVRFKVQTVFKEAKGCIVVAYIDARLVIERLNLVYPAGWQARFEPIDGGKLMWCHLDVKPTIESEGQITSSDVGEGQGATDGMRYKAAVSDSLKRAAVHFGVGVSVYALPQITLWKDAPHVAPVQGPKGPSLKLTETGHVKLREGYAKWLAKEDHGFGEPLSHGDVEGQVIDEDEARDFTPEPAPALEDERALELIEEARGVYGNFDGRERKQVPSGKFNAWLANASHSHDELEKLVEYLRALRAAA